MNQLMQLSAIAKRISLDKDGLAKLHEISQTDYSRESEAHTALTQQVQPLGFTGFIVPVYRGAIGSWRYTVVVPDLAFTGDLPF